MVREGLRSAARIKRPNVLVSVASLNRKDRELHSSRVNTREVAVRLPRFKWRTREILGGRKLRSRNKYDRGPGFTLNNCFVKLKNTKVSFDPSNVDGKLPSNKKTFGGGGKENMNKTHARKKGLHRRNADNYDLGSDSSILADDEDNPSKPVPSWALQENIDLALSRMVVGIEDQIFAAPDPPKEEDIFRVTAKRKRIARIPFKSRLNINQVIVDGEEDEVSFKNV